MFQFSKAWLLVTLPMTIVFPSIAETRPDERPQVVVSVYNDAGVAETVMEQAEEEAEKILNRAGLNVAWQNCPTNELGRDPFVRASERSSPGSEQGSLADLSAAGLRPAGRVGVPAPARFGLENLDCASVEWPIHLALRVVPRSRSATNEVFGVAFLAAEGTGCYSDVFYDQAMALHADWNVGLADILGTVIAHELGHLLLGSNSHSGMGIMTARWQSEELRALSRGGLRFTDEQAHRMSRRVNGAHPGELAARATY